MKKLSLFFLFLFLFVNAKANWELFPIKQNSFYRYETIVPESFIISFTMDTIANRGSYDALFFNRTHSGVSFLTHYSCFSDLNSQNIINTFSSLGNMDSLVVKNDTAFYDSTLYFLPHAVVSQSWPFNMGIMKCDSHSVLQFHGITDSVKYFSSSQFSYILSKNYGFIKYVPFFNVKHNFHNYTHNLVGFEDLNGTHGFIKPTYLDFFPYQVGDILVWKHGEEPPWQVPSFDYLRDSIKSISVGQDTIQYLFDRVIYSEDGSINYNQNISNKFLVSEMINKLEAPSNWFAITNGIFGYPSVLYSEKYIVETDSSISYIMLDGGSYVLDSSSCTFGQITDTYIRNTYNTFRGHTSMISYEFYPIYDSLVGAVLNGIIWGDTTLHVDVNELVSDFKFTVYPNPVSHVLNIKAEKRISSITLTNNLGMIVRSVNVDDNFFEMNISDLPSACYILNITDKNNNTYKKLLIKN